MQPIVAPIKPDESGPQVAHLQDALRFLLDRGVIRTLDPPNLPTADELSKLAQRLATERAQSLSGDATRRLVLYFQLQEGLGDGLGGAVDEKTAARLNDVLKRLGAFDDAPDWVVRGTVRDTNGKPLPGIFVLALDRDLRPERSQPLAKAVVTGERGFYEIRYPAGSFARAEAGGPDIQVQAFDSETRERKVGESPILFNAGNDVTIDFSVQIRAAQASEFERHLEKILPLLVGQRDDGRDLAIAELTASDIDFIASDTGIERQHVMWLQAAHQTGAELEHEFGAACCYGCFRLGLPTEPAALWATAAPRLVQALKGAIAQQIVPAGAGTAIDAIEAAVRRRQAELALKAPRFGGGAAASLGDVLTLLPTPLNIESQHALAVVADELQPDDPKLVERIAAIPGLDGDAPAVARALRLGALTEGNLPLARALLERFGGDGEVDGTLQPLAALRPDEWLDLTHAHGVPGPVAMAPAVYADELAARIERAHPTAALAVHLGARRLGKQPMLKDAGRFLRNNPTFEIGTANLRSPDGQFNVDGVEQPEELFAALRGLQHMQMLGARWEETAALYDYGVTSPHRILMEGPTQLNRLLDGQVSTDRVNDLYDRARDMFATTFAAFTAAFSSFGGPKPLAGGFILEGDPVPPDPAPGDGTLGTGPDVWTWLRDKGMPRDLSIVPRIPKWEKGRLPKKPHLPDGIGKILAKDPTLQSLFGPQDSCACEHCLSVLSPAAYFVDVLQFLQDIGCLQRLFVRRPDLQDLELTCENTDTLVPAIDLALEVLENAAALPLPVPLPAGVDAEAELGGAMVGASVREELERTVRHLKGTVRATPAGSSEAGTSDWTVVDAHRRWTLTVQKKSLRALTDNGTTIPLETAGLNVPAIVAALNQGQLAAGAEGSFAALLGASLMGPSDLANYEFTITRLLADRSWRVVYRCVAELEIDVAQRTLILRTPAAAIWLQKRYDQRTIDAVKDELAGKQQSELLAKVLAERFPGARRFTFAAAGTNRWKIASADRTLTMSYTPVGLTISSLAYQRGDPTVDALAWPENHNPAAYALLKAEGVSFPWTLPVDLPLEEVRLFLERARSSRRPLMELMRPITQTGASAAEAREVLGLSEAEAKLIAPASSPTADQTFAHWGLTANRTRIWDAAAGENAAAVDALGLLKNVSILLQQSRLSFEDLEAVLATGFVQPPGSARLAIAPRDTCVPSDMRIDALTPAHLERIHRFVRLQRRLQWSIADLDTAIRVCAGGVLDDTALTKLADVARLVETVDLPLAKVLAWWSDASADGGRNRDRELAGALNVTTAELAHAIKLLEVADAFASPSDTLRLCERMAAIRRRGISFEDLRYLLQHEPAPASDVELSAATRDALAQAARDAVRSILEAAGVTQPLDPSTAVGARAAEAVVAALAGRLGAGRELVDDLLRRRLRHPTAAAQAAITVFLDNAFFGPEQPPPLTDSIGTVIVRLYKSVVLCTALGFEAANVRLLRRTFPAPEATGLTALDFDTLPAAATAAPAPVAAFEQLLAILDVRDLAQGTTILLRRYATLNFAASALAENVRGLLAAGLALGAKADDAEQVRRAVEQLQITTADQYRDPVALHRLLKLLLALKQLGATVAEAQGFIASSPTDSQALEARDVLRKKFGDSPWRELVKPIADRLRERQRDVLVDYLIARDNLREDPTPSDPRILPPKHLRDANDLYEHYLIDVQTGSCLNTTRLLAATAAAQLFVQRCMLNLEARTPISQEKRDLWGWMHRYRVWEANRKVFLFPENWLLPELRDDKTAIFRQMEGVLTDQEPSLQSTREALVGYLEELGELTQIATVALYVHSHEATGDRTLYIVGRTPNQPYKYYWRSCSHFGDRRTMFWGGWEALELDNANDYLMPFVFQGNLHIAWPTFRSTTDEEATNENDKRTWEVQLAWIRHSARGWTKRKLGKAVMLTPRLINKSPEQSFTFRLSQTTVPGALSGLAPGAIKIDCFAAKEIDFKQEAVLRGAGTDWQTKAVAQPNDNRGKKWHNAWVDFSFILKAKYQPDGEPPLFDDLKDLDEVILTLEYDVYYHDEKGDVGTFPVLIHKPGDTFGPDKLRDGFGLWIQNGSELTAKFTRPGSQPITPQPLAKLLRTDGTYEGYWSVVYTVVFDTGKQSPRGLLRSERSISHEHAGAFYLDSLKDISVAPARSDPAARRLPLIFEGESFENTKLAVSVLGNGFSLAIVGSDLPVPGNAMTTIDRGPLRNVTVIPAGPFGPTASSLASRPTAPLALYVRDDTRRFFIWIDEKSKVACPDGHVFVGGYRQLTAASTFGIFERSIQALQLDYLDDARPANALRTVNSAISFQRNDPYANYNWELFLHLPLAVSDYLVRQQRFEDARRWLHTVFDPTAESKPKASLGFWKFLPFDNANRPEAIAKLLTWLVDPNAGDPDVELALSGQIEEWKRNPFMPHLVARLRQSAYQWYAFFAYVELLIGWGDQLFRRDTRESVNEATLLYVLAAKMLGPRPRDIPVDRAKPPQTYRSLPKDGKGNLAQFSEAWLGLVDQPGLTNVVLRSQLGTAVGRKAILTSTAGKVKAVAVGMEEAPPPAGLEILASLGSLAFCIPRNSKIDELHDLVERRLWNIRHCRNIEGVARELPLFEPPIDPLLLIKAKAAGLDLDTVLASYPPATPHYRFPTMLQKAKELAAEVKSLGAALLAALEKKDAEELAVLRSRHEIAMLTLVRDTRQRQIDEADTAIVALEKSQETVRERFNQYQRLIGKNSPTKGQDGLPVVEQASVLSVSADAAGEASGLGLVNKEITQLRLTKEANDFTTAANILHIVAGLSNMAPNISFGLSSGAYSTSISFGGSNVGASLSAIAKAIEMFAADKSVTANRLGTLAGYERRQDEWVHQSKMALAELKQLDKQILAAKIRKDIAEKELASHKLQIENAKEVDEFFREKFTSKELYRWMSSRLAEVYFRGYQLAHDLARRAEHAFRHELGESSDGAGVRYIQPIYWDSLKKGLLTGEVLTFDLDRMEAAYLDRNKRDYEITKHVSVSQLDPVALIELKELGKCSISIPEVLFDLDFPGHYYRRLKSVALSIPCVAGPYVGVNCKLTLTRHAYRRDAGIRSGEKYEADPFVSQPDNRFVFGDVPQDVVMSIAQNDTGLFETNLRDERYLPFEGAGAISEWKIELPDSFRAFDYGTISDVILHLRFTARDGGSVLKEAARDQLTTALNDIVGTGGKKGLSRVFSLRHEFASEWYRFVNPTASAGDLTMAVPISKDRFPAIFRDPRVKLTLSSFQVLAALKPEYRADHPVETTTPGAEHEPIKLSLKAGNMPSTSGMALTRAERFLKGEVTATGEPRTWTLAGWLEEDPATGDHSRLDPQALQDVLLVCHYSVSETPMTQ